LNPSAVYIVAATMALNTRARCLFGSNDFIEAKKLSCTIRLVLSRYREIAKSRKKVVAVLCKASIAISMWY
jgi:hypothetical protein